MSSSRSTFLTFSAALAVAGCSNDGSASATAAPVPGDLGSSTSSGAAPVSPQDGTELAGPRADDPPRVARKPRSKVDPKDNPLEPDPAKMDPDTFVAKEYCLMPKLSQCSAYGEKYARLNAVTTFCNSLGGERATSCPEASRVARCMTPANVITSYYSSGEKPHTKESAEQKCNEKQWLILP